MFEVEKPRRFHYEPRFYDPEKEKWEALKKKYAPGVRADIQEHGDRDIQEPVGDPVSGPTVSGTVSGQTVSGSEEGLEYFEGRLRELDREKREASARLTWRDLFRRREMPKFEYQPRFGSGGMRGTDIEHTPQSLRAVDSTRSSTFGSPNLGEQLGGDELVRKYGAPRHKIKIRRRFDIADSDYMKPIPGTKIILYTGIVCLLLAVIFLF